MNSNSTFLALKSTVPLPAAFLCFSLGFWIADFSASLSNQGKFQYIPFLLILLFSVYHYNLGNLKLIDYSPKYIWLSLYLVYGITGIATGKLYFGSVNGPLPLVVPYTLLFFNIAELHKSTSMHKALRYVSLLCLVGNILIILTRIKAIPLLELFQFSHENSYTLPLAIGCAILAKSKLLLALNLVACVGMFQVYPAGTYLLTFAIIGCFSLAYFLRKSKYILRFTFAILWLFEFYYIYQITFHFNKFLFQSNAFYSLLGKADNSLYRKILSDQLLIYFYERPIFGFGFGGEVLVATRFSTIPAHNDYLTIAVAGGLIGLALFLLMTFSIQWNSIQKLSQVSDMDCKILFILLCTTNVFFVSVAVNPLGMKVFNSLIIISCLLWVRSISESYD